MTGESRDSNGPHPSTEEGGDAKVIAAFSANPLESGIYEPGIADFCITEKFRGMEMKVADGTEGALHAV